MKLKDEYMIEQPEALSVFVSKSQTILLAGDILQCWSQYKKMFDETLRFPLNANIYSPKLEISEKHCFKNSNSIKRFLLGDWFDVTIFAELPEIGLMIYNCQVSNLSFVIGQMSDLEFYINKWDKAFIKHVFTNGIGTGEVGQNYIMKILEDLTRNVLHNSQRFTNVLDNLRLEFTR